MTEYRSNSYKSQSYCNEGTNKINTGCIHHVNADYFGVWGSPYAMGKVINYKKNIDSNKLFLCCDECMRLLGENEG